MFEADFYPLGNRKTVIVIKMGRICAVIILQMENPASNWRIEI